MSDYGALTVAVQANTAGMERTIRAAATKGGDEAGRTFGSRFMSGMGGALKTLGKGAAFAGIGVAAVGVAKGLQFAKGAVVDFNSNLEQTDIAFTTMLGSGKRADAFIKDLQNFAAKTPFEFEGLTKNAQTMMGMGIAAKDVLPDLKALGDSTASVGGDAGTLSNTITAFSQTMAKGTLDMGNMNQMLQGGIPNALKILASSYGKTTGQMVKMISSGDVMSKDALPRLVKGIENGTDSTAKLGGMMDKQSDTFQGALSNIKDVATQVVAGVGKPLFDQISKLAKQFAGFLASPQFQQIAQSATEIFGGWMTKIGPIIKAALPAIKSIFGQIGSAVGGFSETLRPLLSTIGTALGQVMKALAPVFGVLGHALQVLMQNLAPVLTQLAPVLADVAGLIAHLLVGALKVLTPLFRPLGKLLQTVVGLLAGLMPVLTPIIDVVIEVANAIVKALTPVLGVITDALKQVIPPVLEIVGAIGEQLIGVIKELMPLFKPLADLIAQVLTQDMAELVAILDILTPILVVLVKLVGVALKVAIKAVTPILRSAIWLMTAWAKVMTWVYRTIDGLIAPALRLLGKVAKRIWEGIAKIAKWVWDKVLHPIFRRFQGDLEAVGKVFSWLWRRVLKPVWGFISKAFEVGWRIIRPILSAFHDALHDLGRAVSWLYEHVIKPVWTKVGNAIETVWQNVIKPVLDAFHDMPGKIAEAFRSMKGTLGTILGGLWKALGEPVYMVAHHVLKPLISGVNWLLDKVGIAQIPISWIESIPHFAEGGRVPGGWGGGDKVVAAVEPGEWVLTKKQARAIGYGNLSRMPRFAEGGMVGGGPSVGGMSWYNPVSWGSAVVGAVVSAGKKVWDFGENVVNDITGLLRYGAAKAFEGLTIPLKHWLEPYAATAVPPGNFMWKYLGTEGIKLIEATVDFIWGKSDTSPEGVSAEGGTAMRQRIIDIAKAQIGKPYVWGAHGPDSFDCSGLVEYAYRMAGYAGGKVNALGATTKQQINMGRFVNSPVPADLVFFGQKTFPHHVALSLGGNKLIQAPQEGENVGYADIWSYEPHYFKRLLKIATGPVANESNQTSYTGSASVDQWASAVATAARLTGTGPINGELIGGILQVMASESGGNPNAQNNTDINARNGIPSQGLMQVIPPTFAAYAEPGYNSDIRDPVSNLAAAMNYMRDRYGSVWKAIATRMQQGWYDEGGLLPVGASIAINHTRKPEPILTADQWDRLTAAATADGGGTQHVVTGGTIDIGPDSQGRLRAWVQDLILEESAHDGTYIRMGGGAW